MKKQNGYIWKAGKSWYARFYRDQLEAGADGSKVVVRRQHAEKLCAVSDKYRTKRDVQPLLDAILLPLNENRSRPESTLSVADYWTEHFWPFAKRELKPSTSYGYSGMWRMYLRPRLTNINLREFRCVDATNVLAAIHREHGLGRKSLRHCKALLSVVFTHAKRAGILDGSNPVTDAGIPRAAEAGKPTYAYSADEVFAMLNALAGVARTAIALMYFAGLRPGEARAATWGDYSPKNKTLCIRSSMWRKYLTSPKTADSVAPVPVAETLAEILEETRKDSGFILSSPTGKAVDLQNLAFRIVRPALAKCAKCREAKTKHNAGGHEFVPLPEWHGWYGLRRGLATLAASVDSQLAAKSLLRHSNVQTTQQFYIKSVPADALRAIEKMDALFQNAASNSVPN
jgi:integrase